MKKRIVFYVAVFVSGLFTFSVTKLIAQEAKGDKCDNFFNEYSKVYRECFKGNIKDEFAPKQIDTFGITTLEDEWRRLDSFMIEYRNKPDSHIFIVVYGGKINKRGELKERPKPVLWYLINDRKVEPGNITVINGGFREKFEFELWLSPSEKISPLLSPAIDIENVVFRGKMKPLPVILGM